MCIQLFIAIIVANVLVTTYIPVMHSEGADIRCPIEEKLFFSSL